MGPRAKLLVLKLVVLGVQGAGAADCAAQLQIALSMRAIMADSSLSSPPPSVPLPPPRTAQLAFCAQLLERCLRSDDDVTSTAVVVLGKLRGLTLKVPDEPEPPFWDVGDY